MVDWNNDGRKDLIIGEDLGYIRIYLNTGTDPNPVFSGYTFLLKGGVKFDCGLSAAPCVVDWNSDGKKDLLCGECTGRIYLMINVGTDADPKFDGWELLTAEGSIIKVKYVAAPVVVDWNRDGKKDLLVGDAYGEVHCFENRGENNDPLLMEASYLKVGAQNLDVGNASRPHISDWNGDGVMDILCGEDKGHLYYFKAVGPLDLSENRIYANTGAVIDISLDAGGSNASRNYIIFGTCSGTDPGLLLPGGQAVLPINWDAYTSFVLSLLNTVVYQDFLGVLDSHGKGTARFDTCGPVPSAVGLFMHYAYALNSPWNYVSNAAGIEFLP